MTDTIITIGVLFIGFIAGWFLKKKTGKDISPSEVESLKEQLDVSKNSGIALTTRLEEAEKRLTEMDQLRNVLKESERAEATARTRVDEISKQLVEEKARLLEIRKEMENAFKALAGDVVKSNSEEFIKMANENLKPCWILPRKNSQKRRSSSIRIWERCPKR